MRQGTRGEDRKHAGASKKGARDSGSGNTAPHGREPGMARRPQKSAAAQGRTGGEVGEYGSRVSGSADCGASLLGDRVSG